AAVAVLERLDLLVDRDLPLRNDRPGKLRGCGPSTGPADEEEAECSAGTNACTNPKTVCSAFAHDLLPQACSMITKARAPSTITVVSQIPSLLKSASMIVRVISSV